MKKKPSKQKSSPKDKESKVHFDSKIISLMNKQQKKTEEQMADFVKEIVKLKKKQNRLERKLKENKPLKKPFQNPLFIPKAKKDSLKTAGNQKIKSMLPEKSKAQIKIQKKNKKQKPKKRPKLTLVKNDKE